MFIRVSSVAKTISCFSTLRRSKADRNGIGGARCALHHPTTSPRPAPRYDSVGRPATTGGKALFYGPGCRAVDAELIQFHFVERNSFRLPEKKSNGTSAASPINGLRMPRLHSHLAAYPVHGPYICWLAHLFFQALTIFSRWFATFFVAFRVSTTRRECSTMKS